jgi:hypothetical protein
MAYRRHVPKPTQEDNDVTAIAQQVMAKGADAVRRRLEERRDSLSGLLRATAIRHLKILDQLEEKKID